MSTDHPSAETLCKRLKKKLPTICLDTIYRILPTLEEKKLIFCIRNPLEGKELALDDRRMIALQAYIVEERRGVKLAPGKH